MKLTAVAFLFGALSACSGADTTDSDTPSDSDTDVAAACDTTIATGSYTANGSCFGMAMAVDVTVGADACAFTLDNWDMVMGSVPTGGTVAGSTVTMTGSGWTDCTGTVANGSISGVCSDGCAFELVPR